MAQPLAPVVMWLAVVMVGLIGLSTREIVLGRTLKEIRGPLAIYAGCGIFAASWGVVIVIGI